MILNEALHYRFARKPHLRREVAQFDAGPSAFWVCSGATLVDGVGSTLQEAYADHVEEHIALIQSPQFIPIDAEDK